MFLVDLCAWQSSYTELFLFNFFFSTFFFRLFFFNFFFSTFFFDFFFDFFFLPQPVRSTGGDPCTTTSPCTMHQARPNMECWLSLDSCTFCGAPEEQIDDCKSLLDTSRDPRIAKNSPVGNRGRILYRCWSICDARIQSYGLPWCPTRYCSTFQVPLTIARGICGGPRLYPYATACQLNSALINGWA